MNTDFPPRLLVLRLSPGADVGGQRRPGVDVTRAAQVTDLHQARGGAQQQVAGLDVAVGDAEIVKILTRINII